ncbi:PolC-type DNA polymerase III [Robiginitalea sp. SC105]|uniref:3'-5' exonuclease n=1 Tax=Robiginitalea sp. SC105 TaxID=2762332 RepID=UPI00163B1377|nr:3'-5' exonuclease [Robiginitalea sp. SC105]MBC2840363.1 3'-5' exonuclease [Robiginitalea sp. SC105]
MSGLTNIGDRILEWLSPERRFAMKLPEDLEEVPFVVLDTETTGLNPIRDRILSIGALRLLGGRIRVNESVEYFLAQDHFDRLSVPIHGILKTGSSPRMDEKEGLKSILEYIGDSPVVGHHISFDRTMIQNACDRHGLGKFRNPLLDTGTLYRKSLIKSPLLRKKDQYSLDDLARKYDLSCKDRHTALGDAYITAMAFLHILEQLTSKGPLTTRQLLKLGKPGAGN